MGKTCKIRLKVLQLFAVRYHVSRYFSNKNNNRSAALDICYISRNALDYLSRNEATNEVQILYFFEYMITNEIDNNNT